MLDLANRYALILQCDVGCAPVPEYDIPYVPSECLKRRPKQGIRLPFGLFSNIVSQPRICRPGGCTREWCNCIPVTAYFIRIRNSEKLLFKCLFVWIEEQVFHGLRRRASPGLFHGRHNMPVMARHFALRSMSGSGVSNEGS